MSQDNTHLLPSHIQEKPDHGIWCSEVHGRCLQIRSVSQGLTCVIISSDGVGSYLFFRVCFFTDSRGSFFISVLNCPLTRAESKLIEEYQSRGPIVQERFWRLRPDDIGSDRYFASWNSNG